MAAIILDSGALIAIERGDRRMGALLHEAAHQGIDAITSCACVAETWRDPAHQARLARALSGIVERSIDPAAARKCGVLLAVSHTSDIADAAVALLAGSGDVVITSDAADIERLVEAAGSGAQVRRV
jgi:uncharacterized protein YaiI (UPF0178 family)